MTHDIAAYYASLPRKRVGAGALFFDTAARFLLVRPTYKPVREIPGGSVEADESPLAAVRREIAEELGLALSIGRLLSVDWINTEPPKDEGLMFLFDGGGLDEEISRIRLPVDELSEFRFVDLEEAAGLVTPRMHRRIEGSLGARVSGVAAYLEEGFPVR